MHLHFEVSVVNIKICLFGLVLYEDRVSHESIGFMRVIIEVKSIVDGQLQESNWIGRSLTSLTRS